MEDPECLLENRSVTPQFASCYMPTQKKKQHRLFIGQFKSLVYVDLLLADKKTITHIKPGDIFLGGGYDPCRIKRCKQYEICPGKFFLGNDPTTAKRSYCSVHQPSGRPVIKEYEEHFPSKRKLGTRFIRPDPKQLEEE
jgi:hypothetical protein